MRYLILAGFVAVAVTHSGAHHPDREHWPVHPPIDLIGPLGNRLPMSYRRRYNRPTKIGGKIAYHIAPSSQEAMRWHEATHRGYYQSKAPRMVDHYFYPKPWDMIRIGPRPAPSPLPEEEREEAGDLSSPGSPE